METIRVKPNQTIYDIAAQYYGNTQAVGEIIANNPNISNDKPALIANGIDPLKDSNFYMDTAITEGLAINIDPNSKLMRRTALKQIQNDITTYKTQDNGTND